MILNYNLFENYMSNDVTFEVINGRYWDFILEEFDFRYYSRNKNEISEEHKVKLKEIENNVEEKLKSINPIQGKFFNGKIKRERIIDFNIITTEHWYTKFFRKDYEDSRFTVPELFEGIELITNNINEITRLIDVGLILNAYRVLIRSRISLYSEIVKFEKINPKNYKIILQTQMKGKEYQVNKEDINRIIKLPPK